MGNACACDLAFRTRDLFQSELKLKPLKTTLKGASKNEEVFIQYNTQLHNTNFSSLILTSKSHSRPHSAFATLRKSINSDSDRISVYKSLQGNAKSIQEEIIYEGELEKYKPGISQKYTTRWCKLTNEGFGYFKNQWASACYSDPLNFIPTDQIKKIKVVKNRIQKVNPDLFEFEICVYNEDELLKISRKTKGFSKMGSGKDLSASSWTVRQAEWFIGEKRFLFGAKDFDTFNMWIKKFEKVIRH